MFCRKRVSGVWSFSLLQLQIFSKLKFHRSYHRNHHIIMRTIAHSRILKGERNNGFDVLYHNMKSGLSSSRDLEEYFKECCNVEESYVKGQNKLSRTAANYGNRGSFGPFWQALKTLAEKLSNVHQQLSVSWLDLIKEVHKYSIDQHKKHREVKDQETTTVETVQCIQQTIVALQKAKEAYHARSFELEKLRRENASQKEIERAEAKLKKSNEDYRALLDKYANVRNEFDTHMTASCKRFQEVEEKHLQQMKDFVDAYSRAWENQYALLGQVHEEFRMSCTSLTIEKLIETLVTAKTTGTDKPGSIEFIEADLSSLPSSTSLTDMDKKEAAPTERPRKEIADDVSQDVSNDGPEANVATTSLEDKPSLPTRGSRWILSIPKYRRKGKKHKETPDKEKDGTEAANKNVHQVDEEGFSIRPENAQNSCDRDSFYSSSDCDSDGEEKTSRIKVEIKPKSSPSNGNTVADNMEDIKNLVKTLRLDPANRKTPVNEFKTLSATNTNGAGAGTPAKPSEDLIGLDILCGNTNQSHSASPNNSDKVPSNAVNPGSLLTSPDDLFNSGNWSRVQTPTVQPLIPGPGPIPLPRSSRTSTSSVPLIATARPSAAGRQTPDPFRMERGDSSASLNNVAFSSSAQFGMSRGPSPLTIGMSDTIPLAVAFSETVNAYFKGNDQTKCRVKLTGDLVMSFPAGIIRVLLDNPCPAVLSFCLKNISNLEQILVNKQLLVENGSPSSPNNRNYSFDMQSLIEHLRKQTDQNKSASYFNIDILKYQVKARPGCQSVPLQLVSFWKCDSQQTDFRLDYSYSGSAMATPLPLTNISLIVPVDGDVTQMQSMPTGTWMPESKRAQWKLSDISDMSENGCQGSIRAKFDLSSGPSTPNVAAMQFLCDGTTLSGIDFELAGSGYRISLLKKRFFTGKYISEAEVISKAD